MIKNAFKLAYAGFSKIEWIILKVQQPLKNEELG